MENNTLKISTKIHSGFLEDTLTQDITTLEAIYDLIDNSIDAARQDIFKKTDFVSDMYGMPKDYSGYCIDIIVNDKEISITDNSLGFSKNDLEKKSFITGQPSNHDFGIGQYGVGLKRALLKIGKSYFLDTDNSIERFVVDITNKDIVGNNDFINSKIIKSNNQKSTIFKIKRLKSDILLDIKNVAWYENAIKGISQRYTIYLEKGLKISVKYFQKDKIFINSSLVKIRKNSRFKPFEKIYDLGRGASAVITAGIHDKYLFPEEIGYTRSNTSSISNEFGIYIICNDRVIVAHSTESIHGWKTKWHNEYNGFVCIVRFVSKNPSVLPINTAKTAITVDSAIFLDAASKIQPIVDDYRKNIRLRYSDKHEEVQLGKNLYDADDTFFKENNDTEENIHGKNYKEKTISTKDYNKQKVDAVEPSNNETNNPKLSDITNKNNNVAAAKPLAYKQLSKIPSSKNINNSLKKANIRKLTQLYGSICTLSLKNHGSVVVIALSVFYESLGTYLGKQDNQDIHSFFNRNTIGSKTTQTYTKTEFKDISNALSYIHKESNSIKHDKDYRMETAVQMIPIMEQLEKMTADMLSYYAHSRDNKTD